LTESERGNTSRGRGEGEAGFLLSREPDAGLDPRGRSRLPAEQGARCGARSQAPGTMT